MRVISASDLSSVDPVEGFRFWGKSPFSRELVQPLREGEESNNVKPVSGLWLSPLLNGHTDCWEEFLDSVGWHGRIPHRVEVDPDMPVMVLDSTEDIEEYTREFCTPWDVTDLIMSFDPSKFLAQEAPALYISRNGIRSSKRQGRLAHMAWDVPSLWINDPDGIYIQRVEPEPVSIRSHS